MIGLKYQNNLTDDNVTSDNVTCDNATSDKIAMTAHIPPYLAVIVTSFHILDRAISCEIALPFQWKMETRLRCSLAGGKIMQCHRKILHLLSCQLQE